MNKTLEQWQKARAKRYEDIILETMEKAETVWVTKYIDRGN